MLAAPQDESLATRFAPYLGELRELFAARGLPSGHAQDLAAFAARLDDPSFHEEMVSMVRSILYREPQPLSRGELMDMLALAVAGPAFEASTAGADEPTRQLFRFVSHTLQLQRRSALGGSASAVFKPETTPSISNDPHDTQESAPDAAPLPIGVTPSLSEGNAAAADPAPAAPPATAQPTESDADPAPNRLMAAWGKTVVPPTPPLPRSRLQGAYWLPGLLALLLSIALVAALSRHPKPAPARALPSSAASFKAKAATPHPLGSAPVARQDSGTPHERKPSPLPPTSSAPVTTAPAKTPSPRRTARLPDRRGPAHQGLRPIASPNAREGVFLASSGMMASHLLFAPAPGYPRLASFTHVQGQVILQVVVARNGSVAATKVLEGPMLLRGAAEHTVRHWRYRPYFVDGKPTDVATIVTVTFQLRH